MSCKSGFSFLSMMVAVLSAASNVRSAQAPCDCYRTDCGLTFLNKALNDFRQVTAGKFVHPAMPPIPGPDGSEPVTSSFFGGKQFNTWDIESWSQAADNKDSFVNRVNSRGNVYVSSDNSSAISHLTLRTHRSQDYQSTAELNTKITNMVHGSFRYRARITGATGACAGFNTYQSDTEETDIEVLTSDGPSQFHATNQPGGSPGATAVVSVYGDRGNWNEWRIDWQAGMTEFLFNGASVNQNKVHPPTQPSIFMINLWSDGGSWSKTMDVGKSAFTDIEYIKLFYNTTSDSGRSCNKICTI